MRRPTPLRRVVVAALMVAVAIVASAQPASPTQPSTRASISNAGCDAFSDYFTIEFLVVFATAFAGLGEELGGTTEPGTDRPVTKEDIQDVFHLIFSPKLEDVTSTLAARPRGRSAACSRSSRRSSPRAWPSWRGSG